MPAKKQRATATLFAIAAAMSFTFVDPAFAGCGGGHHGHHNNNPQDGGDDQGDHHRRHGRHNNPGNDNNNNNDGQQGNGGHHRRNHGGGRWHPEPTIGVGIGGTYGVPGGRIGPPTAACAQSQQLTAELNHLWTMRQQIASGRRVLPLYGPGTHTISVARLRRDVQQGAVTMSDTNRAANELATFDADIARIQAGQLEQVDHRIGEIQTRLGQLGYECQ